VALVHIVEDDLGVCDSLRMLLEQMGHSVAAHADAESFFESGPPGPDDVVLVDLGLPGIAGADIVRWVSRLDGPPHIVVISGLSQTRIDEMLRDVVAPVVLLRKPLSEAALADAI